jgi:nitrite reductase/ring-hydroxylating ferredoxin subunit
MTASLRWFELPDAPTPGTFICRHDSLLDGVPQIVRLRTNQDADAREERTFGLVLLRSSDAISAYVNRCAHFGIPLARAQHQLIFEPHRSISCNVHYAAYRWSDGRCLSGECDGESLISVPLDIGSDGDIRIALALPH